jgi:hypothetical protein
MPAPSGGPVGELCSGPSMTAPDSRSLTYSRSRSFSTSFTVSGRRARHSVCHCATDARYSSWYVGVEALRRLPRDRRWRAPQAPRDLAHTDVLSTPQSDLPSFRERQITARHRRGEARSHGETSASPRPGAPDLSRCVLRAHPACDRLPELDALLTPHDGRPSRRRNLPAIQPRSLLPLPHTHQQTSN